MGQTLADAAVMAVHFKIRRVSRWCQLWRVRRVRVRFLRPKVHRDNMYVFICGVIVPWWRYNLNRDDFEWTWGGGYWIWRCGRFFDLEVETR